MTDASTYSLFRFLISGLAPATCRDCGFETEMEPDQDAGYCERCGGNGVVSCLIEPALKGKDLDE